MTSRRHRDHVVYGEGAIRQLPPVVERDGHRRVLLVTGKGSFEASGASAMMPDLERAGEVLRWADFSANTDSADLIHGLEVTRSFDPDVVVGIGGGSPMDMAKLLVAYDDVAPGDLLDTIRAGATVAHRNRGLILAPTTSGSGSEATHFAVVYIGDEKFSIAGPAMRPDAVVLDPLLAMSGSDHQRATSGMDALCQSIESLWAVAATDESRRYARYGLCLVSRNIRGFVHEPSRSNARAMCIGSHLAGRAIDISKTTAAHALSYAITKRYGIDHGNAVALTLGALIGHHERALRENFTNHLDVALGLVKKHLCASDQADTQRSLRRLLDELGLVVSIDSDEASPGRASSELVAGINVERLANNPVRLSAQQLAKIMDSAFDGLGA